MKKEREEKQVCIHCTYRLRKQYILINLMLLFLSIKKRVQIGRVKDRISLFYCCTARLRFDSLTLL